MESLIFDIISWLGLIFCISAFFIKNIFWLRATTLIGCTLLFVYYSHIDVTLGVVSNLLVLLINAYYMFRTIKWRKNVIAETQTGNTAAILPRSMTSQPE